jgi:hypothetical protein
MIAAIFEWEDEGDLAMFDRKKDCTEFEANL